MQKPLTAGERVRLADFGAISVRGADALKFLQGQLSNDVQRLAPGIVLLAGLHNPQGRTVALLRLLLVEPDHVLLVLPAELATPVAQRLSKFVLRAKAKVVDASSEWAIVGRVGDAGARTIEALPAGSAQEIAMSPAQREAWRALDIAEGIPQVYAATSEAFVAQMLNLDLIDAVAWDKGCYTGQEVIARAHYRGKVKRRMQRFRTLGAARFSPGGSGTLQDGRPFKVVDAVSLPDGSCELLAVAPLDGVEAEADEATTTPARPSGDHDRVAVQELPLPYPLPA